MNEFNVKITNCMDCEEHIVLPDPDPDDWFNDDDEKVLCNLSGRREITCSCRPYQKRAECDIPDWCPKLKECEE